MNETREEQRARLKPILDQMKNRPDNSVFLDLCELVLMLAAEINGSIKWDHPRVMVYIRQRKSAALIARRRGAELDQEQR